MKHLKWIAIIIVITIVLIKLFVPPLWTWTIPESINESKRTGAFLWEYEISRIDTLEPNYNFPKFKNIWMTKDEVIERNKFGIIHLVVDKSSSNNVVFSIQNKDTLFNMDNYWHKWKIRDDSKNPFGQSNDVLVASEVNYSKTDTIYYTIYRMIEAKTVAEDELIPVFRMELVAKPDKD
ncbi:hypothetical protein FACS189413_18620 [Bacteroidia bacterium]|nr:hypothetical protein FACS189413_18620 [Bacteroidia bacterium]